MDAMFKLIWGKKRKKGGGDQFVNGVRVLYSEANAERAMFNGEVEDMLCFTGHGRLSIKTANFPVVAQKLGDGEVVGFKGSKVYCLCGERLKVPRK